MALSGRTGFAATLVALAAVLGYLRDPAWLSGHSSGLRPWAREPDGTAYRWSGGHASFFVPARGRQVRIPVSATFDPQTPRGSEPMMVTFTIDDVRAARVLLSSAGFRDVILEMPASGSRRVRRVDVRTSVTREDNHGVKIGEVTVTEDGLVWRTCCLGSPGTR